MNSTTDILIKNLAKTMMEAPAKKVAPYDTQAEVRRIEGSTAWVHIPGGVDETPVQLTTNAKKGDMVQVRVSGGQAWLYGNATAPPTDDTKANEAEEKAVVADEHATDAMSSASIAKQAADEAIESASTAASAASQAVASADTANEQAQSAINSASNAQTSANNAYNSALNANFYAKSALSSLADMEDVVDVLGWISEHGTYSATTDIAVNPNKSYYVKNSDNVTYTRAPVPVSTYIADMYEQEIIYNYFKTEDGEIESGKTYYVYDSTNDTYTAVVSPVVEDIDTYYERTETIRYFLTSDASAVSGKTYYAYDQVNNSYSAASPTATIGPYYELELDSSVRNYIMTHLAVTEEGLEVVNDNSSYRMVIGASSIKIKNAIGTTIAEYGSDIVLGGGSAFGMKNVTSSTGISFKTMNDQEVAYFGQNSDNIWEMHIDSAYIEDMLKFGYFAWIKRQNGNMTLKWIGA